MDAIDEDPKGNSRAEKRRLIPKGAGPSPGPDCRPTVPALGQLHGAGGGGHGHDAVKEAGVRG